MSLCLLFSGLKMRKVREIHFLAKHFVVRFDCVMFVETCYWTICGKEKNEKVQRPQTTRIQKQVVSIIKMQTRQSVEQQRQFQQFIVTPSDEDLVL